MHIKRIVFIAMVASAAISFAQQSGPGGVPSGAGGQALGYFISTASSVYGILPNAHTLTDGAMTSGSGVLTDASASYASSDVGKTAVVNQAGASAYSSTLTSALTTGSPITSLAIAAHATAIPAGWVILTSGANTQTFTTPGATASATTLTVDSQTPNFAYPSTTTTVVTPPLPLVTTIASFQSATQVTLTATASQTITSAEVVYGTDNFTGLQAAANAAIAANLPLWIAPSATGDGILYNGTLTIAGNMDIIGGGVHKLFVAAAAGNLNNDAFPTLAPYLAGSVLIEAGQGIDALAITKAAFSGALSNFGIRFAGKWTPGATGHGIDVTPPVDGSFFDHGVMSQTWQNLDVYGHDGNHYAYNLVNIQYCTLIALRGYGGGGINLSGNGLEQYGNDVLDHPFMATVVAGSTFGYHLWAQNSQLFNKVVLIRPQSNVDALNPAITGYVSPRAAQANFTTSGTSVALQGITLVASDFEGVATGSNQYPTGTANNSINSISNLTTPTSNPTSGVCNQNTSGSMAQITINYTMSPTGAAAADVLVQGSSNSSCTSPFFLDEANLPISGPTGGNGSVHFTVLPGNYYKVTVTNATRANGTSQLIPAA